jgi:uncharacterized membrane protein
VTFLVIVLIVVFLLYLVASFSVSVNFRPVDNASKAYIILIVNYGSFNYMGANLYSV